MPDKPNHEAQELRRELEHVKARLESYLEAYREAGAMIVEMQDGHVSQDDSYSALDILDAIAKQVIDGKTWQPIATAPTDNDARVLLWGANWLDIQDVAIGERWHDMWLDNEGAAIRPTHWMPLPDPPKEKP